MTAFKGFTDGTKAFCTSDRAPWMAKEFFNNSPDGWFLLDKYHLIEHINEASEALKTPGQRRERQPGEKKDGTY